MFSGQTSVLELCNVFHTGQVETGGCIQKLSGRVRSGLVLKDVSLTLHSGELLAVLGSKGSGKRALLDVISGRAHGATRGQILLNGGQLSPRVFQRCGAYVTRRCDLLPGLSTEQSLLHAACLGLGSKVSRYVRWARVKQVLADLALTHVAHRGVERLDDSEYRRLAIGVQLVRDPVLLLLDEPTSGLSPLHAYLVLSMLASHARQSGRLVILSMERPRSDVFPFLDRVAILCLGDVVFAGKTNLLLDYFQGIGFPCPELENPLMYYLCLSTVDRRSRDRFLESTQQIAALVEKFKLEGGPFSHDIASAPGGLGGDLMTGARGHKLPLCALGRPGALRVSWALLMRQMSSTFNVRRAGLANTAVRLFLLPLISAILLLVFSDLKDYQRSLPSRSGLVFNCLAVAYFVSTLITVSTFPMLRTRYYQERREGLYSGAQLVLTTTIFNLPISIITVAASAAILLQATGQNTAWQSWVFLAGVMWACYLLAEQQAMALLSCVKSAFSAALTSGALAALGLVLASGTLRSYRSLPAWLHYITWALQPRYAGTALHQHMFAGRFSSLPHNATVSCPVATVTLASPECRYSDGDQFLSERLPVLTDLFAPEINLAVCYAFPLAFLLFNIILYVIPLPDCIKDKFRE